MGVFRLVYFRLDLPRREKKGCTFKQFGTGLRGCISHEARQLEAARMKSGLALLIAAGAMLVSASVSFAQETSTNRVDSKTDWSVFEGDSPKECWAVTTYKESVNTREGREVSVSRGSILLMVFYRPGDKVRGQVAFTGGYPFAKDSTVQVQVGGSNFDFFTEGEWAWPLTPQDDAKVVASMKRGANAIVTARSARGTQTKDTFSLLGFTAAIEEADKRCP